jgi:hypothetical protein
MFWTRRLGDLYLSYIGTTEAWNCLSSAAKSDRIRRHSHAEGETKHVTVDDNASSVFAVLPCSRGTFHVV